MRHVYPLPADEPALWPRGEQISGRSEHHLGRRILDSGLQVCWGDGIHWAQVDEPTSPRGKAWRLNSVFWLAVNSTVPAPPPGCYAAFFRVRQRTRRHPFLAFSAEWKVVATPKVHPSGDDYGFLPDRITKRPCMELQQEQEAAASWSHVGRYDERDNNAEGWVLLHIGNVMVRQASDEQRAAAAAAGSGLAVLGGAGRPLGRNVTVSFGGNNPYGVNNLEVDFAAIAPLRLSWDVERVLMIGNRKGHPQGRDGRDAPPETLQEEGKGQQPDRVAEGISSPSNSTERGNVSPLASLPYGVMSLVLEYSQPTLVRPHSPEAKAGPTGAGGVGEGGQNPKSNVGYWKVF